MREKFDEDQDKMNSYSIPKFPNELNCSIKKLISWTLPNNINFIVKKTLAQLSYGLG